MKKANEKNALPERKILHQSKDGRVTFYQSLPDDPHLNSGWILTNHPGFLKSIKESHEKTTKGKRSS